MKSKVIVFNKKNSIKLLILISIILIGIFLYITHRNEDVEEFSYIEQTSSQTYSNVKDVNELKEEIEKNIIQVEEYTCMPKEIKGYKVIGKLSISSINLDTYILEETNNKTLNVSVTKLEGPDINTVGNFCITGHNYLKSNMFGKLKKVNKEDKIILTDTFGKEQEYIVYDKFEISPDDTDVLNQNTNGKKEVTLITCTIGAIKRLVVKAVEI